MRRFQESPLKIASSAVQCLSEEECRAPTASLSAIWIIETFQAQNHIETRRGSSIVSRPSPMQLHH